MSNMSGATQHNCIYNKDDLQRVFQSIIQFHNGCLVSTAVAVVWSTKDGHHILVMAPVITLKEEEHT